MRPLLIIGAVGAAAVVACRKTRKRRRKSHLHFELWNGIPPGAMAYNRTGLPEHTFNQAQWERMNRIIHGGDE